MDKVSNGFRTDPSTTNRSFVGSSSAEEEPTESFLAGPVSALSVKVFEVSGLDFE